MCVVVCGCVYMYVCIQLYINDIIYTTIHSYVQTFMNHVQSVSEVKLNTISFRCETGQFVHDCCDGHLRRINILVISPLCHCISVWSAICGK